LCYKCCVIEDAGVQALLDEIVVDWTDGGVLDVLRELVPIVWRRNLDRYEPARLGDDAMTLGVQSSRNLCNLAVRRLASMTGVTYKGRVLHAGKVTSRSPVWDVSAVDWSQSEVRTTCAEINTKAYMPTTGTLFETVGALPGQRVDPRALRRLQLMWQGFDDGGTRAWLGFPRLGIAAWFAVVQLDDGRGGRGGLPVDDAPMPPVPDFDTLGEPVLGLARRAQPEARPQPQGA
jgi:hypothetical protein